MAHIPDITIQDVYQWFKMKDELNKLKIAEHLLRQRIFMKFFPLPMEGTNTLDLGSVIESSAGYALKAKYPIERKIDPTLLKNLSPQLAEAKINVDSVVRYKPELALREYRTLTAEQAKVFNQCLDIKPGSVQLSIEPIKK